MSENQRPTEGQGKKELTWEEVQAFVEKRQKAVENGEPDVDSDGGPSWEEVQAFVEKNKGETVGTEGAKEKGLIDNLRSFLDPDHIKEEDWDQEEARRRKIVEQLLPDGNVRLLFESETCLLCNDTPHPRECYAVTDMGHVEPKGKKSSAFGFRVKTKVGSMVPLQISCCSRCRRNYRIASYLSLVVTVLVIGLTLLLLALPAVERALVGISDAVPLIIFLLSVPIGWAAGRLACMQYIKAKSRETKFHIDEIPFVARMEAVGWFPLYDSKDVSRLIFSKERLSGDWFTK
jgi:hypothetical protein